MTLRATGPMKALSNRHKYLASFEFFTGSPWGIFVSGCGLYLWLVCLGKFAIRWMFAPSTNFISNLLFPKSITSKSGCSIANVQFLFPLNCFGIENKTEYFTFSYSQLRLTFFPNFLFGFS